MVKFGAGLGLSSWHYEPRLGGGKVQTLEEMMFLRLLLQVQIDDLLLVKGWKGSWRAPLTEGHCMQTDATHVALWSPNLVLRSKLSS